MFYGDADESFDAEDIVTRTDDGSTFHMVSEMRDRQITSLVL